MFFNRFEKFVKKSKLINYIKCDIDIYNSLEFENNID